MRIALFDLVLSDITRSIEVAMGSVVIAVYVYSLVKGLRRLHPKWAYVADSAQQLVVGRIAAQICVLAFSFGAMHALLTRWGDELTIRSVCWSVGFLFAFVRWAIIDRTEWKVL